MAVGSQRIAHLIGATATWGVHRLLKHNLFKCLNPQTQGENKFFPNLVTLRYERRRRKVRRTSLAFRFVPPPPASRICTRQTERPDAPPRQERPVRGASRRAGRLTRADGGARRGRRRRRPAGRRRRRRTAGGRAARASVRRRW